MVTSVVTAFYRDWNVMATSIVKAFYRDRNVMVTPVVTAFYMKRDGYISTVSILQTEMWWLHLQLCNFMRCSCKSSSNPCRQEESGKWKYKTVSVFLTYLSVNGKHFQQKKKKKPQKQNINCKSSGNLNCLQWVVIPHVGGVSSASNVHLMHTIKTPTVKTDLWSTNPSLSVRSKCSHLSNHEQSHTCN